MDAEKYEKHNCSIKIKDELERAAHSDEDEREGFERPPPLSVSRPYPPSRSPEPHVLENPSSRVPGTDLEL